MQLGGLGSAVSSPGGSRCSQAAKGHMVLFGSENAISGKALKGYCKCLLTKNWQQKSADQTGWLLAGWNSSCAQGTKDAVVQCQASGSATGRVSAYQTVNIRRIDGLTLAPQRQIVHCQVDAKTLSHRHYYYYYYYYYTKA